MWKNNRTIQFAVGITVIFIVVRWLLTGDLLFAINTAASPPLQGETKANAVWSTVWPLLMEAIIWIGASTIAYSLKIWDYVLALINSQGAKLASAPTGTPAPGSPAEIAQALLRAIALNDIETEDKLRRQVRRPYAVNLLVTAIEESRLDDAKAILAELEDLSLRRDPISAK